MITLKSTLKVTVVFLCIISIAFFTTCKGGIGLGGTIDINPPTIYAAYPPANAVVRDTFTLKGMIDDDVGVKTVTVSYIKADGHPASARALVDNGNKTWQIVLNQKDSNGKFLIGDGRQVFNILAEDQSGKTASIEWFLTIDNTPPLLILNRPSTKALNPGTSYRDGDAFGADFWLVGQVYDKSDVAKLEIEAKAVGSSASHIETVYNIPQNIRLKVTSFSTGGGTFYNTLYGSNTREDGKKNFSYTVRVYDSAKTYTNPGEAANSSEGNYTDVYYLSDDLYEKVFSKPDNKIQDVYEVLYGTAPASITNPAEIKTEFANKKIGGGAGQPVGTFALNPSLNPRFEIVGRTPSKNASGTLTPSFSNFFASSLLQVRLSRNLDDVPLNEVKPAGAPADPSDPDDDTYRFSHFFLAEWDTYKTYLADLNFDINTNSIYSNVSSKTLKSGLIRIPNNGITCEKEGGNYLFTIPIHKTTDLTYGKQYVLLARGRDKGIDGRNKNELIAAQGEGGADLYGITLVSTSQPPTVSVVKINNTGSGGGNITEQVYIKKGDNVSFSLDLSEIATVAYRLKQGLTEVLSTRSQSVVPPLHPTMPITINNGDTGFNQTEGGNYQLVIKATNDGGGTSPEQTYYLVYDVKGPQIKVIYPVDNAKLDRDSKLLEISGTAFDAGVGLKTPAPLTVTLTKEGGSPQTVNLADNGENWKSQPIDLSGSNYGDGKYTLTVTAQDTFDQPTTVTRTFVYDAAPPAITGLTVDGIAVTNGSKVYTKNGTVTVSGTVVETYEVKEFTIKGQTMPLSAGAFTKSLTLAEESHSIVIKVKDKADKETTQTVTVVTDQTLPEFENIDFAGQAASGAPGAAPIVTTDNPIRITGTIKDSVTGRTVSGVKEVNYAIADSIDASTVWKPLSGEFTGSDYTVNGFVQIPAPGVKKVNIKVTDNAGNEKIFTHAVQVIPATVAQFIFEILDGNTPADTVKKNAGVLYAKGQFKVKIGGILATAPAAGLPIEVEIRKEGTPPTVDPGDFFDNWNPAAKPKILTTNTPSEYTVKPSVDAGEYTITITAQGQERSQTVVVDKTGPAITIVEPSTVASTTQRPVFKASISDNAGIKAGSANVYYKKVTVPPSIAEHSFTLVKDSDGSYSFTPASDMEEGTYELYFSAEDTLGNKTTTETTPRQKIIIDTALPALADVKVNSKAESLVYIKSSDGDVSIAGKATDSYGIEKVEILENGAVKREIPSTAILPPDYTWTASFSGSDAFADGSHNLTIRVTDKAGKTAELQKTVVVDRVAPTINPPTHGLWRNTHTLFVTGTASDTISNVYIVEAIVTGGTPLQETLTLLSGTENWSGNLTLNEGDNTVKFRVTDKAGNTAETPAQTIKVDTGKPVITLITPANGQVRIKDQTYQVALTVSDIGSSGIKKIEYATAADFVSATDYMTSGGSVTIGLTGITADVTYYFRAVDEAGNTSDSVRVSIQKDSAPPEVAFISHHDNQEVNKKITIRGSASDDKELTSVKIINADGGIDLTGISDSSGVDPADSETAGNKALFKGTKAYNWRFTLDTEQYTDNTELKLKAIATDAAGNIMEKELTLKVNQNSDRPVVTVTSFSKIEENKANLVGTRTITGKVEDDDGAIGAANIKIRVSPKDSPAGSFVPVTVSNGVWTYTIPADKADGAYQLDFELTDAAGTDFKTLATTSLARPYVMGYEDVLSAAKDQNIAFRLDTVQPEFKTGGAAFVLGTAFSGSGTAITPNAVIGNNVSQHASFRVFVKDASGIKGVKLTLNNGSAVTGTHTSASDADGYEAWDFSNVQLVEGAVPLAITATDNANFEKTWQETIISDFTPPTVSVEASGLATVYYRNADIIGQVAESGSGVSGIDVATIEYKIGNAGWFSEKHVASDSTELSKFERSAASWKVSIADVAKYKDGYGAVPPSGANNKIHTIDLQIKVKDKAGNEKLSDVYQVKFDPTGSTPILELITPDANATLGTSVSVSGLARTARPEASQPVKKIELQLSQTNAFGATWMLNGHDYGNGFVILTSTSSTGYNYWQKTLEQAVITDILGSAAKKDVWLRVRGISADGSIGDWTEGRKCTISKDVAEFSSIQLAVSSTDPSPEPYVPNGTWIKGDTYVIKGSVTHSTGIKTIEAKTENASSSVQSLDTSNSSGWFTARTDGTGYDFAISVKTSHYAQKSGSIEFDIIAEDNRTGGQSIKVRTQVRLKYDNSVPVVAIGTPVIKGDNTHFASGTFTPQTTLDSAKKNLYRVIANNNIYTVNAITASSVTLSPNDLTGSFDYAIVEQPKILQDSSCQIEGIGEDSGSHIQKVKIELTVNGQSQSVMLNASDSSRPIESLRNDLSSFKGSLDTTQVPNGEGTLKVTAYDGANNEISDQITTIRVKNNPLHISKLTLRTDLDGNGSYTVTGSDETHVALLTGAGNGLNAEKDFRGSVDVAAAFTYKNNSKSELVVELTGGYGTTRKVVLYKDDASGAGNKITEISVSSVTSSYTLDLAGKLNAINDGDARKLILRVYDSSVGEHWYAETKITVKVAHEDNDDPSGVIAPFFYNTDKTRLESADDFKLTSVKYDEGTKQPLGHIEIGQITGLGDRPSVSGTVILRGIAYDNFRIKTLKLSGAGINGGTGCTITNTSGMWSTDNGFKVVRDSYSRTGHYVEWEYEWATGMPALDQKVTLTVTDEAARTNGTATGEPATKTGTRDASDDRSLTLAAGQTAVKYQFVRLFDETKERSYLVQVAGIEENGGKIRWANVNVPMDMTQYVLYEAASNKKTLDVNIVPYITNVETALSSADSAGKGAFSRASTGEYPVRVGEKIKITGFNLTGASYKLGTQSLTEGTGTNAGTYEIGTTHSSGALVATVVNGSDTIESINNKVNVAKLYNQEGNGVNNNTLTANRKLFVWKTEELINNAALESPQFVMDKQSKYYISYGNLKTLKDPLDQHNQKKVMRLSSKINGIEDNTWEYCYSKFHNTVIGYDDNGNPYIGATNTDRAGESTAFTLFFQQPAFTYAYLTGSNKRRLENSDNRIRGVYDVNRVQIPKMAVRGGGTGLSPAKLAVVYFDNNVDNDAQVKFRYGTIRGADTIDGGISHDVISTGNRADPSNSGSAKGYEIVANSTSTFTGGQYAAVGLTSTNRAIVVWYDAANSQLVYSYRDIGAGYTAPAAGGNRQTTEWQNNAVVVDGGAPLYVDIALDDQDGLHIGYYSSGEGGVKYAYLPPEKVTASAKPATSDFKVVKVDTFMNPGTYLKIGVRKESGKQVPYISYYHTGFYGSKNAARIAWLKDGIASDGTVKDGVVSNKFTGDWVVMTVPATAGIKQYTICQGVPTGGTYADKVIAAYFTNKNYEMAVLRK